MDPASVLGVVTGGSQLIGMGAKGLDAAVALFPQYRRFVEGFEREANHWKPTNGEDVATHCYRDSRFAEVSVLYVEDQVAGTAALRE